MSALDATRVSHIDAFYAFDDSRGVANSNVPIGKELARWTWTELNR